MSHENTETYIYQTKVDVDEDVSAIDRLSKRGILSVAYAKKMKTKISQRRSWQAQLSESEVEVNI